MKKQIWIIAFALVSVLTSCTKESTTSIKGYVYTTSGAPVNGAKVTVVNKYYTCWKCAFFCGSSTECGMLDKKVISVVTDKNGYYEVDFLTKEIDVNGLSYFTVTAEQERYASKMDTIKIADMNSLKTMKIKPQATIRFNFIDDINVNIGAFDGIYWEINNKQPYGFFTLPNSPKVVSLNFDLGKTVELNWESYKIDGYNGGKTVFTGSTQRITVSEQKDYDLFIRY